MRATVDSPLIDSLQSWYPLQLGALPGVFFNLSSVPQPGLDNRVVEVKIGSVVGGSSAVNSMMAVRGSREEYDAWGRFFGGEGSAWSWDGLLPYFKKAVAFSPPRPEDARAWNLSFDAGLWGGAAAASEPGVRVSWPTFQFPSVLAAADAWRSMPGIEYPVDGGAGLPGFWWYPQLADPATGTRSYARTGHHEPAVKRANYHLITGSKVTKVLFEGNKAAGVSFVSAADSSKPPQSIRATKEVILTAGAIHTPQILQLSGIGPKPLLDSVKIPVLVDLPGVGQNFQDHANILANFTCTYLHTKRPPWLVVCASH